MHPFGVNMYVGGWGGGLRGGLGMGVEEEGLFVYTCARQCIQVFIFPAQSVYPFGVNKLCMLEGGVGGWG